MIIAVFCPVIFFDLKNFFLEGGFYKEIAMILLRLSFSLTIVAFCYNMITRHQDINKEVNNKVSQVVGETFDFLYEDSVQNEVPKEDNYDNIPLGRKKRICSTDTKPRIERLKKKITRALD